MSLQVYGKKFSPKERSEFEDQLKDFLFKAAPTSKYAVLDVFP